MVRTNEVLSSVEWKSFQSLEPEESHDGELIMHQSYGNGDCENGT